MGSYGIGVSRLVAVLAEQNHVGAGLVWPREVAPADVHLVTAGKSEEIVQAAERLANELVEAGLRVLFDDRKSSPGVKFADAELIGVPTILVVGRGLANGQVEVKDRRTGERIDVGVDSVVRQLVDMSRGQ
jgi:prolyl-tRNA synthetase